MQIGSLTTLPPSFSANPIAQPEAVERGPDRDNDGDEGARTTATLAAPPAGSGRGGSVDLIA